MQRRSSVLPLPPERASLAPPLDLDDPTRILAALRARFASPDYRPPMLPAVAVQVYELSRRSDASLAELVGLVERDPLLTAEVVRRAQSPYYAGRGAPARTLSEAALRLGISGLAELVLQAALTSRVFRVPGLEPTMEALRRHSVATAHAARALSSRMVVSDADVAFLAGLLHDVGEVVCLHALADLRRGRAFDIEQVLGAVHACSSEAGRLVVALWGLPPSLVRTVEEHHAAEGFDYEAVCADPAAACVLVADHVAVWAGATTPFDGEIGAESPPAVLRTHEELTRWRLALGTPPAVLRTLASMGVPATDLDAIVEAVRAELV